MRALTLEGYDVEPVKDGARRWKLCRADDPRPARPARRVDAARRRAHRVPRAPRRAQPRPDPHAHGAHRDRRPRRRPRRRRRRLPPQAVRPRRAAGPYPGAAPAGAADDDDGARTASSRSATCGSTRPPGGRGARQREIELSKTEFDLLELLVRNAGIVLDHTTIYDRIWHYDFGPDSKNLAVYIGYLRRKTEAADGDAADPHRARRGLHRGGSGSTSRASRARCGSDG